MPRIWAFLAELDPQGSLDFKGKLPSSLGLPPLPDFAWEAVFRLAKAGKFEGCQVDWGAWAVKVNSLQLQEVLDSFKSHRRFSETECQVIESYRKYGREIGESRYVAFVAAEL